MLVWIFVIVDHYDVTWDGSKGGEFWRIKENSRRWVREFFGRRIGELEVLAVRNHKLCFDIAQILSVVLGFFSIKLGIM